MGWDPFGSKAAKKIKQAAAAAAEAARAKGEAEAAAFRFNAEILEGNADVVREQSLIDEARNRRLGNRFMGEQEAAIASSGFDTSVGFDPIKEATSDELDLDAIIIRRQGQFRGADFDAQSELALMNADMAIKTGEASAKLAILNGQAQAQAARSSAIGGTISSGVSLGNLGMNAWALSDARIKENVERIGTLPTGAPLYAFNYIWDDVRRVGVMAQEIQKTHPEAVRRGPDGILMVDYGRIGLPQGYSLAAALKQRR